jgi:uncharacterized protein
MSASSSDVKSVLCPICGKEAVEAYRPFCSKRCADIDLARWFTGSYAIAGREDDDGDVASPTERPQHAENDDDEG